MPNHGYRQGDTIVFSDDVYGMLVKVVQEVYREVWKLQLSGTVEERLNSLQSGRVWFRPVAGLDLARIRALHHSNKEILHGHSRIQS